MTATESQCRKVLEHRFSIEIYPLLKWFFLKNSIEKLKAGGIDLIKGLSTSGYHYTVLQLTFFP